MKNKFIHNLLHKFNDWRLCHQIKRRVKGLNDKKLNDYYINLLRYKDKGIFDRSYYQMAINIVLNEKHKRDKSK